MAGKKMYFGTAEYMTWVPCPVIEADVSTHGWGTSGTLLNGGAFVRNSTNRHKRFGVSWNMAHKADLTLISDFERGLFGPGPFYLLMPGTFENVLPLAWSVPRLAVADGVPLVDGVIPTLAPAAPSLHRYPTGSAVYSISMDEADAPREVLTIPVPEGHYLHLGVHGSFTDTAAMSYSTDDGATWTPLPAITTRSTTLTNTSVAGAATVLLSLRGIGSATLNAMVAEVSTSATPRTGSFVSGDGHSGVEFENPGMSMTMYSAVKDLYSASATLIEVGQWL